MAEVHHACRRRRRTLRGRRRSVPPDEGGIHGTAAHEGEGALDEERAVDYAEKSCRWWRDFVILAVGGRHGWARRERTSGATKRWQQELFGCGINERLAFLFLSNGNYQVMYSKKYWQRRNCRPCAETVEQLAKKPIHGGTPLHHQYQVLRSTTSTYPHGTYQVLLL